MSENPLSVLPQSSADTVAALFLNEFYGNLTSNGLERHKNFYARNASINLPEGAIGTDQVVHHYEKLGLDKSFIDISKGVVDVTPTLAQGVKLNVKGLLKREIKETEVHCNFTHNFLLMPIKSHHGSSYYILNEKLTLGKETTIAEEKQQPPKSSEKKPAAQTRAAPPRSRPAANQSAPKPKPADVKPSSYASALGAVNNSSSAEPQSNNQVASQQNAQQPRKSFAKPARTRPIDDNSIVAKRLPEGTTEDDLRQLFKDQGKIVSVDMSRGSGKSAFIEFDSPAPVAKFLELDPKLRKLEGTVNGKEFSVSLWKKDAKPPMRRPMGRPAQ